MDKEFIRFLTKHNIEAHIEGKAYTLYCAKPLDDQTKSVIQSYLRGSTYEIVCSLKQVTKRILRAILADSGTSNGTVSVQDRHVTIIAPNSTSEPDWDRICLVLSEDQYPTSWSLQTDTNNLSFTTLTKPSHAEVGAKPITDEDIQNLIIDLNNSTDVGDFIKNL